MFSKSALREVMGCEVSCTGNCADTVNTKKPEKRRREIFYTDAASGIVVC